MIPSPHEIRPNYRTIALKYLRTNLKPRVDALIQKRIFPLGTGFEFSHQLIKVHIVKKSIAKMTWRYTFCPYLSAFVPLLAPTPQQSDIPALKPCKPPLPDRPCILRAL